MCLYWNQKIKNQNEKSLMTIESCDFYCEGKNKIICLVCKSAFNVSKLHNFKHYYKQYQSKYNDHHDLIREVEWAQTGPAKITIYDYQNIKEGFVVIFFKTISVAINIFFHPEKLILTIFR